MLVAPAYAAPVYPALSGRVVDAAKVLPPATVADLTAKLAALETATGTQLVVATVPSLSDYPIEDYGVGLLRAWGIGQKGTNNGAILIVAPNDRKVRVEVGFGLEGRLTDALSATIIRRNLLPAFRAGDIAGGVAQGTDALIAQLQLPPDEARANVAAAAAQPRAQRREGGGGYGGFIWLAILGLWLFFAMFRGRRGQQHGSGIGSAILWGVASSMFNRGGGGGGDWGGGGGFGGGGGGFSGGGGSGGGGGASGSW